MEKETPIEIINKKLESLDSESEISKAMQTAINEVSLKRKSYLEKHQTPILAGLQMIADLYNITPVQRYIDNLLSFNLNIDGRGHNAIVSIAGGIRKEQEQQKQMISTEKRDTVL